MTAEREIEEETHMNRGCFQVVEGTQMVISKGFPDTRGKWW